MSSPKRKHSEVAHDDDDDNGERAAKRMRVVQELIDSKRLPAASEIPVLLPGLPLGDVVTSLKALRALLKQSVEEKQEGVVTFAQIETALADSWRNLYKMYKQIAQSDADPVARLALTPTAAFDLLLSFEDDPELVQRLLVRLASSSLFIAARRENADTSTAVGSGATAKVTESKDDVKMQLIGWGKCDVCLVHVEGLVKHCTVCPDFDMCTSCFGKRTDQTHDASHEWKDKMLPALSQAAREGLVKAMACGVVIADEMRKQGVV